MDGGEGRSGEDQERILTAMGLQERVYPETELICEENGGRVFLPAIWKEMGGSNHREGWRPVESEEWIVERSGTTIGEPQKG